MTIRVGVIGAGAFGIEHLRAYASMDDVQIVGVSDVDQERAARVAQRFGTVAVAAEELDADAVSLVIPAHARAGLTATLIDKGTALLIEKPLSATGAEADRLAQLAQGKVVMVGHLVRCATPYRRLAEVSRAWGPPRAGSLSRRRSAAHATEHPHDDVIGLTMIHDLDATTWLSQGRPMSVSATGVRGHDGRWFRCRAQVLVDNGSRWTVEVEWAGEPSEHADYASIGTHRGEESIVVRAEEADTVYGEALAVELRHFVDHASSGKVSDLLRMGDAALAVRLADAVRRSLDLDGAEVSVVH